MSVIILIYAKQSICITYTQSYMKHSSLRFYIFFSWPTLLSLMFLLTLFSLLHSLFSWIETSLSFTILSLLSFFSFLCFLTPHFDLHLPSCFFIFPNSILFHEVQISNSWLRIWLGNPLVVTCFHRETEWNCYCTWSHRRVFLQQWLYTSPQTLSSVIRNNIL